MGLSAFNRARERKSAELAKLEVYKKVVKDDEQDEWPENTDNETGTSSGNESGAGQKEKPAEPVAGKQNGNNTSKRRGSK